jgi:hypothetical protein
VDITFLLFIYLVELKMFVCKYLFHFVTSHVILQFKFSFSSSSSSSSFFFVFSFFVFFLFLLRLLLLSSSYSFSFVYFFFFFIIIITTIIIIYIFFIIIIFFFFFGCPVGTVFNFLLMTLCVIFSSRCFITCPNHFICCHLCNL